MFTPSGFIAIKNLPFALIGLVNKIKEANEQKNNHHYNIVAYRLIDEKIELYTECTIVIS